MTREFWGTEVSADGQKGTGLKIPTEPISMESQKEKRGTDS